MKTFEQYIKEVNETLHPKCEKCGHVANVSSDSVKWACPKCGKVQPTMVSIYKAPTKKQ